MSYPDKNKDKDKLHEIRIKVDETSQIMQKNIEQVIARGEKLSDLEEKATHLEDQSNIFRKSAVALRKKMCCNNAKTTMIIGGGILFALAILIIIIVSAIKK